ncbi:hypothetical protein, partial [Pseudomonas aeruginosa]
GALDFRGRTDHSLSELLLVDNLPTLLVSVPISNNQGSAPRRMARCCSASSRAWSLAEGAPKSTRWSGAGGDHCFS